MREIPMVWSTATIDTAGAAGAAGDGVHFVLLTSFRSFEWLKA